MLSRRNFVTTIFLITAVTGLSGCASPPPPREQAAGPQQLVFQEKRPGPEVQIDDGASILPPRDIGDADRATGGDHWLVTQNALELVLHGSSSCPPEIEKVIQEFNGVKVHLKEVESSKICTLDLRRYTFEVLAPVPDFIEEVELVSDTGAVTLLKLEK